MGRYYCEYKIRQRYCQWRFRQIHKKFFIKETNEQFQMNFKDNGIYQFGFENQNPIDLSIIRNENFANSIIFVKLF